MRFLVLWIVLAPLANAQLVRPSVIILEAADGVIGSPGSPLTRLIKPGGEAYPGETLKTGNRPITFAACIGLAMRGTIYSMSAHSEIGVEERFKPQPILKEFGDLPICVLPELNQLPTATTFDDPDTRRRSSAQLHDPITQIIQTGTGSLRHQLLLAQALAESPQTSLIGAISEAEILRHAGLLADSLSLYAYIESRWPEATWTRDIIAKLGRLIAVQPETPQSNSSEGVTESVQPPPPKPGATGSKTYALLLGISQFNNPSIPRLCFAAKDALTFSSFLESPRGGRLDKNADIRILTDKNATRDAFDFELANFVKGRANKSNTLILFIAGHGKFLCTEKNRSSLSAPCDPSLMKPYILTADSDPAEAKTSGISMVELAEMVTARASEFGRVLVFVDVCHAGHVGDLPESTRLTTSNLADSLADPRGPLGILMANSNDHDLEKELALEMSQYGHGVFTYFVLDGLNKGVSPIDGKIYFERLFSYVLDHVQVATNLRESPAKWNLDRTLVAVDNVKPDDLGIHLEAKADACAAAEARRDLPLYPGFEDALQAGRLLPDAKNNAFNELSRLAKNLPANEQTALQARLRVSLEEAGQSVLLKYLQGDQITVTQQEFERGADYFKAALSLAPNASFDESRYLFCKGRADIFDRNYSEAEALLDKSIRIDPARSYSMNALGIALLEQVPQDVANFQKAVAAFQLAIRYAPYWAYPRHNLALAEAEQGHYREAIQQYEEARQLAPRVSYLPYNQGLLLQQVGDLGGARKAYTAALDLASSFCGSHLPCPSKARVEVALGSLFELYGKKGAAKKWYQRCLESDPAQMEGRQDLAILWSRDRRHVADAERLWRLNLADQPRYFPTLIAYSNFLIDSNRLDEAVDLLKRLTDERKQYLPAALGLAEALLKMNRAAEALPVLERFESPGPSNSQFWMVLARTQAALSKREAAKLSYHEALIRATGRREKKRIYSEAEQAR